MRMYKLEGLSIKELKEKIILTEGHCSLSIEEKKANIEAINSKLNLFSKKRDDVLKDIEAGSADISDMGGVFR